MKITNVHPSFTMRSSATALTQASPADHDTLQSRFALRVASNLNECCEAINPDITERLRFAREQALERARNARLAGTNSSVGMTRHGALILGRLGAGWWLKLASALPIVALVAGLVLIQHSQDIAQVIVAAEIDAALLADALPPVAYSDAGFVEYLKTPRE